MKYEKAFAKYLMVVGVAGALSCTLSLPCRADDEISMEQIRRELHEAASTEAKAAPSRDFTLTEKDIEVENARLEAQEAELLKKLSSPEAQALVKDVASGKSDGLAGSTSAIRVTGKGNVISVTTNGGAQPQAVEAKTAVESALTEKTIAVMKSESAADETSSKGSLRPSVHDDSDFLDGELDAPRAVTQVKLEKPATETKSQKASADSSDATIKALNTQLGSLRRTNSDLTAKLQKAGSQVTDLSKQLETAKNRLMLAESEVERLATVLEARNRSASLKFSGASPQAAQQQAGITAAVQRLQAKATEDTPIATVVTEKANLRTGPGADNSPLMSVTRGTRLVVETKQGDWYRVISPTGTRAWVSSDVVAFGPSSQSSPTRTVRIKGYDSALESEDATTLKSAR